MNIKEMKRIKVSVSIDIELWSWLCYYCDAKQVKANSQGDLVEAVLLEFNALKSAEGLTKEALMQLKTINEAKAELPKVPTIDEILAKLWSLGRKH